MIIFQRLGITAVLASAEKIEEGKTKGCRVSTRKQGLANNGGEVSVESGKKIKEVHAVQMISSKLITKICCDFYN